MADCDSCRGAYARLTYIRTPCVHTIPLRRGRFNWKINTTARTVLRSVITTTTEHGREPRVAWRVGNNSRILIVWEFNHSNVVGIAGRVESRTRFRLDDSFPDTGDVSIKNLASLPLLCPPSSYGRYPFRELAVVFNFKFWFCVCIARTSFLSEFLTRRMT